MSTFPRWLTAAVAVAMLALLGGGTWFYRAQEGHLRQDVETSLRTISLLKADQIAAWRGERLGDAAVLTESPFLSDAVAQWLADPQPQATEQLLTRFRSLRKHYRYRDVLLVDVTGRVRLSIEGYGGPLHEEAAQAVSAALRDRGPVLSDLHVGPGDLPPHVDVVAPMFVAEGAAPKPVGAIVLQTDARQYLYPLIQSWPTTSHTAEVLLVRRDGDAVWFLNDLRYQPDAALKLRIPLSRKDASAMMAVLGNKGTVQGTDYRGAKVLSALAPVPDSPWFLVAKIDVEEAFVDWRVTSRLILALILGITTASVAVVGWLWQRNRKVYYRDLFRAEEALRESLVFQKELIDAIPAPVFYKNTRGRYIGVNKAFCEFYGQSESALVGKTVYDVAPKELADEYQARDIHLLQHPGVQVYESQARDAGGGMHEVVFHEATIQGAGGQVRGIIGVILDVTERKRAEAEIDRARRDWEQIFQAIGHPTLILDAEHRILAANSAAVRAIGRSQEGIVGRKCCSIFHGTDSPPGSCPMVKLKASHRLETEEMEAEALGGVHLVSCTPVYDDAGRLAKVIHIATDITERKRAQEALERSERLYRTAIDAAGAVPYSRDYKKSRYEFVGTGIEGLTGYPREEFTPQVWDSIIQEMVPCGEFAGMTYTEAREKSVRERMPVWSCEYRIRRRGGDERWLMTSAADVRDDLGNPVYSVGIFQDITERKQAEKALERSERLYRGAIDAAGAVAYYRNYETNAYDFVGAGIEVLTGYPPGEFAPDTWESIIQEAVFHGERTGMSRQEARRRFLCGETRVTRADYRVLARDGEERWLADASVSVFNEQGKLIGSLGLLQDISARKRAEEALERSERLYRGAIDAAGAAAYYRNYETNAYDFVGPGISALTGCTKEEFTPDAWESMIQEAVLHGELQGLSLEEAARKFLNGETRTSRVDYRITSRNGEERWLADAAVHVFSSQGKPIGSLGLLQDITEHKRAEDTVRKNEAMLQSLLAATPAGVGLLLNRTFMKVNAALCKITGYSEQEMLGASTRMLYPDDEEFSRVGRELYGGVEKNGLGVTEARLKRKDGTIIDVLLCLSPFDPTDLGAGVTATVLDITERKRTERALRENEERYRALVNTTKDVIYSVSADGTLRFIGPQVQRYGYSVEELLGRNFISLIAEEDRPAVLRDFELVLSTGEAVMSTFRVAAKDGNIHWFEEVGQPIRDSAGQIIAISGMLRDVTDRRQAEEERRRHTEEIERFNRLAIGREQRVLELKRTVNQLSRDLGRTPPFATGDKEPDGGDGVPPSEGRAEAIPRLDQLIHLNEFQELMDGFCEAMGIASAIIDLKGVTLVKSHWQRLCTDFHRVNEAACRRCIESDTELALRLSEGRKFTVYQCLNGLTDAASPIVIEGRHVANMFVGQFFLHPPSEEFFRRQAAEFGFDEKAYLAALREVPVVPEEKLPTILDFLANFAVLVGTLGLERFQQQQTEARLAERNRELRREREAALGLAEDAEEARRAAERSQEELRRKTEELDRYFTSALDLLCIADTNGIFHRLNPEWEDALGYPLEELIGRRFLDFVHPDDLVATRNAISRLTKQETVLNFVNRYRHKDGSYRWMEWRSYPAGEMIYAVARDITDHKRAEESVRAQHELAVRLGAARSLDEGLSTCLEVACRVSGMDAGGIYLVDEATGSLDLATHRGIGPSFVEAMRHFEPGSRNTQFVLAGKAVYTRYSQLGEVLDVAQGEEGLRGIAVLPVLHEGRGIGCLSVASHASDEAPVFAREALEAIAAQIGAVIARLRTEEAREASERKYRTIFQDSIEALSVTQGGRIADVNPAWLQLHGYDAKTEVLGMDVMEIIHPEDRQILLNRRGLPAGERKPGYELRDLRKDGTAVSVEVYSSPILLDGREAILTTLRDVTERKQIEEQIRRTQRLQSVGTLASGVAHNFNNVLGIILGNAELARMRLPEFHEAHKFLDDIGTATERAASLAQRLLSVSRQHVAERTLIPVSSLIDGISQAMRMMLDSNVEIDWRTRDDTLQIEGNRTEIEQALMNICLNARDAMPRGGKITLEADWADLSLHFCGAHQNMKPGRHVCISISDTGTGMDEATLAQIFDPFFTTKGPGEGTGLGLYMVYGAVANHGGCVDVQSQVGVGTTFRIYLPPADEKRVWAEPGREDDEVLHGSETILLVDDEENILMAICQCLMGLGYEVLTAKNGEEAIRIYKQRRNDIALVILDYMMPRMDGQDTYAELKKMNPDVRVLVASGYDAEDQLKPLLDAGVNGFIHKPYRLAGLSRAVRNVLDGKPV